MSAPQGLEQQDPGTGQLLAIPRIAKWPTENRLGRVLEFVTGRCTAHCLFQTEVEDLGSSRPACPSLVCKRTVGVRITCVYLLGEAEARARGEVSCRVRVTNRSVEIGA
jgi:hypothetical protein